LKAWWDAIDAVPVAPGGAERLVANPTLSFNGRIQRMWISETFYLILEIFLSFTLKTE
jgi:hypothetical protein